MSRTDGFTPETRMLIDGSLVGAASGKTFDNINPATEEVLGPVADASREDMQRAIAAARRAFEETDWSTNRELRKRCLEQLQDALEAEREELREELIAEVGTPRSVTYMAQLEGPLADAFRYPAKLIDEFPWERSLSDGDAFGTHSARAVWKEPLGVVGSIVPWNYPFEVTSNKIAQVLATGNTTVLKPAPDTPWNATRLGRLVAEKTDMPAGVFNVVTSSDHLVGEELTLSPLVDMISFTGSTVTGKRIMEKGAATLKRVFLELGGKSAMIVCDDADFASVVPAGSFVCMHAGQGCAMQTRMLLPRSRYDEGVELITQAMAAVAYGDPQDPANFSGPLISSRQRDRVLGYIAKGQEEGAKLVLGGGRPAHLPKGYYVEPTLFVDVDNSMTIAQEEIFGPVLCVIPYEDDDDAVRIANESAFGLSGGVFSASEERATAIARRVRTGSIGINGGVWYGADSPYGGYKTSGIGRQNGLEGFEQYLETKAVAWLRP
ncbi:aldehyde dehydrogenase family protein [Acidiferrimicrobium sp. IK]|uniref:aldehyde dehydrogenase family protein n=1 Tax=Acidiferrimicrobium sp. IK TaxID=2871700 RepID=UPI0021CB2E57|nr:aldehyde dehydrogenase family protein [Acidiferrimicrobium sp. IK]MCU4183457.1 aldehyde dehydrogenase family protein [Acidiferrimicrobium sp. IK]